MIEEIKENIKPTLEYLKICVEDDTSFETANYKALYNYITNLQQDIGNYVKITLHDRKEIDRLQQDLDKANDIIKKDRQFNAGRLLEIANLKKENERLKEQNNDLRKIYRNTYKRLFKNGNDELARYFQAQIDDCPTFYVEPIIDFHKEWKDYKSRCEKTIEYINFVINHYKEQLETPIEDTYFNSDVNRKGYILSIIAYLQTTLDTLNGSDEE